MSEEFTLQYGIIPQHPSEYPYLLLELKPIDEDTDDFTLAATSGHHLNDIWDTSTPEGLLEALKDLVEMLEEMAG